jgi:RNA polymerase sigma-70 factor (sigma-E family)
MRFLSRGTAEGELDFTEFVREASPRLLRTAFLLTGGQHIAEDLVQEALERACRRWRRIAAAEQPEAYVRRIVVNLANDRWRKLGRSPENLRAELPEVAEPRDHFGQLEMRGQLITLLETLPIRMRTIIVLRYFHDMDDAEIADVLGVTPATVRSQISRGLARLREVVAVPQSADLPLGGIK